jgi:hypothetical protein
MSEPSRHNPEDKAAQATLKEAVAAEDATCNTSHKLGKKIGKIAATNLDELCLKARYADVWDEIGDSIIDDLLALDHKPKASASKEAKSKKANMLASPSGRHHKPGGGGTQAGI